MLSVFFFFKQKTAYEITVRDWSSDVCSSDLQNYALYPHLTVRENMAFSMRIRKAPASEIGRASCRERVLDCCVDLGGRRIIKKKKKNIQILITRILIIMRHLIQIIIS